MKNKIIALIVFFNFIACSTYFGKEDGKGKYQVNEKHWTLKNISNTGIKRVLDTKYWYIPEYSFTNQSFFFNYNNEKKSYNGRNIWFFDSGHVLFFSNYSLDNNKIEFLKNGQSDIDFGSQGFYTVGSKEFEIEYFQRSNVSIAGSMDRYYYQASIEGNKLYLTRKSPFKKNVYHHYVYTREAIPEGLLDIKANW